MLGYHHQALEKEQREENALDIDNESSVVKIEGDENINSHGYNEKIHKIYRSHRGANCTDWSFIEKVMFECISF